LAMISGKTDCRLCFSLTATANKLSNYNNHFNNAIFLFHLRSVPSEASAYLGFVGFCVVFLIVFYLYLSKKLCFTTIGNFPCCDDPIEGEKKKVFKNLGNCSYLSFAVIVCNNRNWKIALLLFIEFIYLKHLFLGSAFAYDDEESSTDSEDEVLSRLNRSTSSYSAIHQQSSLKQRDIATNGSYHGSDSSNDFHVKQSHSTDRLISRSTSRQSVKNQNPVSEIGLTSNANGSIKTSENGKTTVHSEDNSMASDLISLAEKGRVGKQTFSGGSTTSETNSADTEEEALIPFLREKAKQNANESKTRNGIKQESKGRQMSNNCKRQSSSSLTKSKPSVKKTHYENDGFDKEDNFRSLSSASSSKPETSGATESQVIKCGSLEVSHAFDAPTKKLVISVIRAQELPAKDRGGANQVQVRLVLLPHKRQKFKTKMRQSNDGNVQFNEFFTFSRISPDDVLGFGLRFRLYGCERMRRENLIGESVISFASSKPLQHETKMWLTLEPRSNISRSDSRSDVSSLARSDSTGSTQSMQNQSLPELLIGLAYNGTTGRLQVSIIKGSQFRNATMSRAPDSYCKIALVSSTGQEIGRSKTSVRRGQPNPLFKETFVFQVALFQLPDVSLMISVYNKRSMKRKEMIGWFSLGLCSSGEEELAHWNDMRETKGEQVSDLNKLKAIFEIDRKLTFIGVSLACPPQLLKLYFFHADRYHCDFKRVKSIIRLLFPSENFDKFPLHPALNFMAAKSPYFKAAKKSRNKRLS
ncbi:Synaptotagmin-14-like protein, partial [Dinothrombium tinctorium]